MVHTMKKEFKFEYDDSKQKVSLSVPIAIPSDICLDDWVGRIICNFNVPSFVEDDLRKAFESFLTGATTEYYDSVGNLAIQKVKEGKTDVSSLVDAWTKAFKENVKEHAELKPESDATKFSEAYHNLIHSGAAETLFTLEMQYSKDTRILIQQRDKNLKELEERQVCEMVEAVEGVGTTHDNAYVTQLAHRQMEHKQLIEGKWASDLAQLQEQQKKEYRQTVLTMHHTTLQTGQAPSYVQRVRALSNAGMTDGEFEPPWHPVMEENFTVNLGAQLKTMHNVRLLACDALDLCRVHTQAFGGRAVPEPRRMQTAMSLYSDRLCGLVLLEDPRVNAAGFSGIKQDFWRVCEETPELHFGTLDQQVAGLQPSLACAALLRAERHAADFDNASEGDRASVKSGRSCGSEGGTSASDLEQDPERLGVGDSYVTRHSNLSEVHLVFHVAADDSLRSSSVTSRHPVIQGLRQAIRTCFRQDVHTLTLPLLLVHRMTEDLTLPWCIKRAELVLKCVKGFMMEMVTWSGPEQRTLQFIVPPELSEDAFQGFTNMLPQIFKTTSAKVIT